MIESDSPLRSLPRNLPPRQVLFLDAIRLSAQMANISYRELSDIAQDLMERGEGRNIGDASSRAITHAYSFVDAANRLREVVPQMRGLKHNSEYELFIRGTRDIKNLRKVVQHLNQELRNITNRRTASMGTITWLGPSPSPVSPATSWILQCGSFYQDQMTFGPKIDLLTGVREGGIADICLTTSTVRVNLTQTYDCIGRFIRGIEGSVRDIPAPNGRFGSDVLMHFELTPVEAESDEEE